MNNAVSLVRLYHTRKLKEAMIGIRVAHVLIRFLGQRGLLSSFSSESTTPDEIHDFVGDSLLGSIGDISLTEQTGG
jgi:hypothetical protein